MTENHIENILRKQAAYAYLGKNNFLLHTNKANTNIN